MTLYEEGPPLLRAEELDIAGRRAAVRAIPYSGETELSGFRFDPAERRFIRQRTDGRVLAGPHEPEAWRAALGRAPAGPVLVGPGSVAEEVWGSYRAACEGALAAGRGIYLLDPTPEGLPGGARDACVAIFSWHPDREPFEAAAASARQGFRSGLVWPVVPGWTAEAGFVETLAARVAAAGLEFLSPVIPRSDGEARRSLVEARGGDDFFETIHHLDWDEALPPLARAARNIVRGRALALLPPRPAGGAQPPGNAAVAARLEEKAEAAGDDEHRASLLRAAARWIDESDRDLAAIYSEGNFRKVFPFGPEVCREAAEAFGKREA